MILDGDISLNGKTLATTIPRVVGGIFDWNTMIETTDTLIDIFVVTYKPDFDAIRSQLKSIVSQVSKETCFALYIWDNSTEDATVRQLKNLVKEYRNEFYVQHVAASMNSIKLWLPRPRKKVKKRQSTSND